MKKLMKTEMKTWGTFIAITLRKRIFIYLYDITQTWNPLQNSYLENPMEEEPGRLRCPGRQRVGHNWNNLAPHWSIQPVAQNSKTLPRTCSLFFHICVLSLQLDCHIVQYIDTKQHLAHMWYWPSPPKNLPEEKKHKTS